MSGTLLKSAEIYDPAAGFFTSVAISRSSQTATLLPDGRVLIVGGKSAELFDLQPTPLPPLPTCR